MNPLDKEELKHFWNIVKNNMPIYTDKTVKVKRSYSQGMPKNAYEYSEKINNEFLNSNLAIIEEINYRDSKHWIPKWFQQYQKRIYGDSDILNKDNFFKAKIIDIDEYHFEHDGKIYPKVSGGAFNAGGMMSFSFASVNRSVVEITSGNSSATEAGDFRGYVWYNRAPSGTINGLYDRIAISMTVANGNDRFACYSDSSSHPSTLYRETGSLAGDTSFTWRSLTEFTLTTNPVWLAIQVDNATNTFHTASADGIRELQAQAYGAHPATATPSVSGSSMYMKLGHT